MCSTSITKNCSENNEVKESPVESTPQTDATETSSKPVEKAAEPSAEVPATEESETNTQVDATAEPSPAEEEEKARKEVLAYFNNLKSILF